MHALVSIKNIIQNMELYVHIDIKCNISYNKTLEINKCPIIGKWVNHCIYWAPNMGFSHCSSASIGGTAF